MYRTVAPVYTRFLDRSISATQSVSRNSEGHMESVQQIKCMLFILIFNKQKISTSQYLCTLHINLLKITCLLNIYIF